jgi:hypothetical protein
MGFSTCLVPGSIHWNSLVDIAKTVDPWDLDKFQKAAKALNLSGVHMPYWRDWIYVCPSIFLASKILHRDHPNHTISLSLHQYSLDILKCFAMADCKPVTTLMEPNLCLSRSQSPQTTEEVSFMCGVPYLAAVGALMYLATTTRPEIAYTVGVLARSTPTQALLTGKLLSISFTMSRALLIKHLSTSLTLIPLSCSLPSLMLIMVVARIPGTLLVVMSSR